MIKKNIKLTLCLIIYLSSSNAQFWRNQLRYQFPDATLTSKQICGTKNCDPGNVGLLLHYTKHPFSPAVTDAYSADKIALQLLGQTIPRTKSEVSQDFSNCAGNIRNLFNINDLENIKFLHGRKIYYKKTKRLNINIGAAVDANVKQLLKLTNDPVKIDKLTAKIQATYERINGKELTVEGKYSEWQLSKNARERLKNDDEFKTCRKWLQDQDQRIVLAIGLVIFDISYGENSIDKIAAEIDAELEKEGINASLAFSFKKEISESLTASSEVFQVIVIRHAGIQGNEFVEQNSKPTLEISYPDISGTYIDTMNPDANGKIESFKFIQKFQNNKCIVIDTIKYSQGDPTLHYGIGEFVSNDSVVIKMVTTRGNMSCTLVHHLKILNETAIRVTITPDPEDSLRICDFKKEQFPFIRNIRREIK